LAFLNKLKGRRFVFCPFFAFSTRAPLGAQHWERQHLCWHSSTGSASILAGILSFAFKDEGVPSAFKDEGAPSAAFPVWHSQWHSK